MKILDRIIIGSSPLAIVEAVFLRSKGFSVLNIDERKSVGGAWSTIKHPGFPEVELGCHIWSFHKETYKLLEQLLNIELLKLSPQPTILYKSFMIPYDWKSNLLTLKKVVTNITHLSKVLVGPDVRFSVLPSKYLYPSKGALSIQQSLADLIEKHHLKIDLNTKVDKVVLYNNRVELFDIGNKLIAITKVLVLTSLSRISSFVLESGEEIFTNTKVLDYVHAHFIVENVRGKSFSYIRTNGDKVIHRVSDMTSQVKGQLAENQKLFCVGIFQNAYSSLEKKALETYVFDFFIKNNLISESSSLIDFKTNVYSSNYNDSGFIDNLIESSNGKIFFLRSTDFVYSFFNQKERYKALLLSHPK